MNYNGIEGFSEAQINRLLELEQDLSKEQMELIANPNFDPGQMRVLGQSFENGLPMETVKIYATPSLTSSQMLGICFDMAENSFSHDQLEQIVEGYSNGLSLKQANLYAKPEFTPEQMKILREALEIGLSSKQVEWCADPNLSVNDMKEKCFSEMVCALKEAPTVKLLEAYLEHEKDTPPDEKFKKIGMDPKDPMVLEAELNILMASIDRVFATPTANMIDYGPRGANIDNDTPIISNIHKYIKDANPKPDLEQFPIFEPDFFHEIQHISNDSTTKSFLFYDKDSNEELEEGFREKDDGREIE